MKLGEAAQRMHDAIYFLVSLFAQENAKFNYTHEDLPDDSRYNAFVDFQESTGKYH